MNEERFDRRLADLLDEETLLAVSGSLFDAKPPRRRVWRRAAAVAAAFVLLLGAVNYQSVAAFAQRAYRYFVSGESWVMETPPASYRLCVDPVEAPDGSGGTYRLLQAVQKEDGTLWLSLEHLPSREVKAELSEGAEEVWNQYLTTLKATLQVGETSYPLTYLPEHLGASSPHMSGEEDALANFTVSFAFSCKVEGEADEIALQIGDSRLRTALQPAVAVSAEEISYEGSDNLSFQLMQLTEKGDAIALIPTVKGLSAETCSVNFGITWFSVEDSEGNRVDSTAYARPLIGDDGAFLYRPEESLAEGARVHTFSFNSLDLYIGREMPSRSPEELPTKEDCLEIAIPAEGKAATVNKTFDLCGVPVTVEQIQQNDTGHIQVTLSTDTPYGDIRSLCAFDLGEEGKLPEDGAPYYACFFDDSQSHLGKGHIDLTFNANECGDSLFLYLNSAVIRSPGGGTYTPQ